MDPFETYRIDKKSDIPIWVQLKKRLTYLIASGAYQPGDQLPTVRELAVQRDINYHTVNKVYHDLESSGLIEVQVGRGSHVADLGNSRFVAFENDARMVASEYATKLLDLGMTPEEAVRAIADHLGVKVTIDAADTDDNATTPANESQKASRRVG